MKAITKVFSVEKTCFLLLACGLANRLINHIGPSGVHALPLAAGINIGGHYKGHFFSLSSSSSGSLLILPEVVVIGFRNLPWATN